MLDCGIESILPLHTTWWCILAPPKVITSFYVHVAAGSNALHPVVYCTVIFAGSGRFHSHRAV